MFPVDVETQYLAEALVALSQSTPAPTPQVTKVVCENLSVTKSTPGITKPSAYPVTEATVILPTRSMIINEPASTSSGKRRYRAIAVSTTSDIQACRRCGQKFQTEKEWKDHEERCTRPKELECTYSGCKFTTFYPTSLRFHLEQHNTNQHACKLCNKTYNTSSSLRHHTITKHATPKYQCGSCTYQHPYLSFVRRHGFKNHRKVSFFPINTTPAKPAASESKPV